MTQHPDADFPEGSPTDFSPAGPHLEPAGRNARVRVAIARDIETAERWRDALDIAGIDAFVEIDDDRAAIPGGASVLSVYTGPRYVYPVNVPAEERDHAAGILINHGWDGAHGTRLHTTMSATRVVWGTVAVLVLTLAVVMLLVNVG